MQTAGGSSSSSWWTGSDPTAITAEDTPTLFRLRAEGVDLVNSHAVFPTVTRVNAAAIATGTQPGTNGLVGNQMFVPAVDERRAFDTGNYRNFLALERATGGRVLQVRDARRAAPRPRARAGRRQLGLDGQRVPAEPEGARRGGRARQRLLRSGQDGGLSGRGQRGGAGPLRARAGEAARRGALRRVGQLDAAGAARVRAPGPRARCRHQLAHRAGPQPAPRGRGLARRARGAPQRRSGDRAGAGRARRRLHQRAGGLRPRVHHQHRRGGRGGRPGRGQAEGGARFHRRDPGQQRPGRRAPRAGPRSGPGRAAGPLHPGAGLGRGGLLGRGRWTAPSRSS